MPPISIRSSLVCGWCGPALRRFSKKPSHCPGALQTATHAQKKEPPIPAFCREAKKQIGSERQRKTDSCYTHLLLCLDSTLPRERKLSVCGRNPIVAAVAKKVVTASLECLMERKMGKRSLKSKSPLVFSPPSSLDERDSQENVRGPHKKRMEFIVHEAAARGRGP